MDSAPFGSLVERVLSGDWRAIARTISLVEAGDPSIAEAVAVLFAHGGRARIVGITGSPGSGKSTLVAAMAVELRAHGRTVGIIAVDPSSPYTGGAILGDRIRMSHLTSDPGVYIRSMAARGVLGGLARATSDAIAVLDAAGKDVVLVETMGIGQDEVDIATSAHTTVVVSVPGMGDDIQALKAGVIEIADVHVVNKADREGAKRTLSELMTMLNLGRRIGPEQGWRPPVLPTVASEGRGTTELLDAIDHHHAWLSRTGELESRERGMAAARITAICSQMVLDRLQDPARGADFDSVVEEVRTRRSDPPSAARRLVMALDW